MGSQVFFCLNYSHKEGPFEDETAIEFFSNKSDASLFMYGSHSKKRPHNLVIGKVRQF